MKLLIFLSCALAFASAGYPYYASPYAQHIPLIDHNGVPVETPEVQQAKAIHLAAHAAAKQGLYLSGEYGGHYGTPAVNAHGTPIDTPEVQLARAAHFIAYNEAAVRNQYGAHAAIAAGPIDTPEVQIAKAAHFAAHIEAKTRSGHHYRKRRGVAYNPYQGQIPAIGHNGVPLDTPEVQAAKANHFAAHAQLSSSHNALAPTNAYPSSYSYDGHAGYHIPVIGHNGVPVETSAVQAAKADHFAAYSQAGSGARSYNPAPYSGPYAAPPPAYGNGAPLDTPEVQAAKAAHLAAHAAAGTHRHY